ncbi:MAG: hypothetical protein AAGF85_06890, partial [Bacteroidota bacterium]
MSLKQMLLTLIMIVVVSASQAQLSNWNGYNGMPVRVSGYDNIVGSPYLHDEWTDAEVLLANGKKKFTFVKYNVFENRMVLKANDLELVFEPKDILEVKYNKPLGPDDNLGFIFKNGFRVMDFSKDDYFRVYYSSKSIEILGKSKVIKQRVTPPAYGEEPYEQFVTKEEFYIKRDAVWKEFKLNSKSFQKVFPGYK